MNNKYNYNKIKIIKNKYNYNIRNYIIFYLLFHFIFFFHNRFYLKKKDNKNEDNFKFNPFQ